MYIVATPTESFEASRGPPPLAMFAGLVLS